MNQNTLTIANVAVRRDSAGRYCLNDLHKAAVAAGANARSKEPGKFFRSPHVQELIALLEQEAAQSITPNWRNAPANAVESRPYEKQSAAPNWGSTFAPVHTVEGGPYEGRGTYVCIELAIAYGKFVSAAFDLLVIRTYIAVQNREHGMPHIQSAKFWDRLRPHWAAIARLALTGHKNVQIAPLVGRSTASVGRCLRRMYEVGYLNPVEVFKARLAPATAARWAIEQPVAAQWGLPDRGGSQGALNFEEVQA